MGRQRDAWRAIEQALALTSTAQLDAILVYNGPVMQR
jgi:hypothetical protein